MDRRLKRPLLAVFVVALVVFAGCTGAGNAGSSGGGGSADGGAAPQSMTLSADTAVSADAGAEKNDVTQIRQRAVIKNGFVDLTVDEFNTSRDAVASTAASYGGYVSDSSEHVNRRSGGTYRSGTLVVRVPSDNFSAFVSDLKGLGEVERVETNSEDVTDQLVDIEARLSNLRAQRDRLRDLYDRANTTEDVLAVEKRLTEVQTEIERLEARQQTLENRVAMSTVRVSLSEEPPGPAQWYDVPVLQAFLESVDGVFVALRALVVGVAYALPYVVVFGGLVALFGGGVFVAGRAAFRRL